MEIVISTAEGDVVLEGKDRDDFISALPDPAKLEEQKPIEEKIADGLKATGMTQAQIDAFLAAIK